MNLVLYYCRLLTGYHGQDFGDLVLMKEHLTKDTPKKLYLDPVILGLIMRRIPNHIYSNIWTISDCPNPNTPQHLLLIMVLT